MNMRNGHVLPKAHHARARLVRLAMDVTKDATLVHNKGTVHHIILFHRVISSYRINALSYKLTGIPFMSLGSTWCNKKALQKQKF
jgi:hypothetical protein